LAGPSATHLGVTTLERPGCRAGTPERRAIQHLRRPYGSISTAGMGRIRLGGRHRRLPAAGAAPIDESHGLVPGQRRGRELVASLKVELTHRRHYRTLAEARTAIFAWIAPPVEWEQQHATINPLPSTMAA
jgi:hypothetical protein